MISNVELNSFHGHDRQPLDKRAVVNKTESYHAPAISRNATAEIMTREEWRKMQEAELIKAVDPAFSGSMICPVAGGTDWRNVAHQEKKTRLPRIDADDLHGGLCQDIIRKNTTKCNASDENALHHCDNHSDQSQGGAGAAVLDGQGRVQNNWAMIIGGRRQNRGMETSSIHSKSSTGTSGSDSGGMRATQVSTVGIMKQSSVDQQRHSDAGSNRGSISGKSMVTSYGTSPTFSPPHNLASFESEKVILNECHHFQSSPDLARYSIHMLEGQNRQEYAGTIPCTFFKAGIVPPSNGCDSPNSTLNFLDSKEQMMTMPHAYVHNPHEALDSVLSLNSSYSWNSISGTSAPRNALKHEDESPGICRVHSLPNSDCSALHISNIQTNGGGGGKYGSPNYGGFAGTSYGVVGGQKEASLREQLLRASSVNSSSNFANGMHSWHSLKSENHCLENSTSSIGCEGGSNWRTHGSSGVIFPPPPSDPNLSKTVNQQDVDDILDFDNIISVCVNWKEVKAVALEKEFYKDIIEGVEILPLPSTPQMPGADPRLGLELPREHCIYALKFSSSEHMEISGDQSIQMLLPQTLRNRFSSLKNAHVVKQKGDKSKATARNEELSRPFFPKFLEKDDELAQFIFL